MRFSLLLSLALAVCGLAAHPVAAQTATPGNDQCLNALLLTSGVSTTGSTIGAADDLPGVVGCQTGTISASYPDVWYAFVATSSTLAYQLTNSITSDSAGLHLFSGSCGNLVLQGSWCSSDSSGSNSISGSQNGLTVGATYYLAVTTPAYSQFTLQVQLTMAAVYPAQDCNQAVVLSQLTAIQQGGLNMGAGALPYEVDPQNSCWGSGGERQPKWYRFTAGNTGLLEFNINPIDSTTDYDWAVWDVTNEPDSCTMKGNAIACNWTGARGATGLSACPNLEPGYQGGDQFNNTTTSQVGANGPITVLAGHVYALLVDNFSTNSTGYTLTFGGACGPPVPGTAAPAMLGLGATFTAAARPGMAAVFTPSVTVNPALAVSYHWSFGDGGTSTARTPTYTYATAGTYFTTLRVTDLLGSVATYGRAISVSPTGVADEVGRGARLSLAPNPARQTVRLTLAAPATSGVMAQLIDGLGRLVRTVALPARSLGADVDLTGLKAGVYSVRVGVEVRRLVVSE